MQSTAACSEQRVDEQASAYCQCHACGRALWPHCMADVVPHRREAAPCTSDLGSLLCRQDSWADRLVCSRGHGVNHQRWGRFAGWYFRLNALGCVLWRRAPRLETADAWRVHCCSPFIESQFASLLTGHARTHWSALVASNVRPHFLTRACGSAHERVSLTLCQGVPGIGGGGGLKWSGEPPGT